eukprot:CAMPEP_0118983578 /NCGR_PEP_ID=MMETSP1173-20130426/35779_1 /TAXON_ID=1034831 /ORGANISM="Rhizochromulina marina cf, Strain CCMP1243" /LENGTH=101 /DNA_ID=CAMNT_0006934171 /DNA_START=8 /DNA_END=310 /DNA_ORIENTATION=+
MTLLLSSFSKYWVAGGPFAVAITSELSDGVENLKALVEIRRQEKSSNIQWQCNILGQGVVKHFVFQFLTRAEAAAPHVECKDALDHFILPNDVLGRVVSAA